MTYASLPKRLESWAQNKVPGLKTYLARENLRDADKEIRDELVKRVDKLAKTVAKASDARSQAKGMAALQGLDRLDRVCKRVRKVRDTIKYDSRGYQGLFDPQEVTERDLMALLDFDEKLFDDVEKLQRLAEESISDPSISVKEALMDFEDALAEFDEKLGQREQYSSTVLPKAV